MATDNELGALVAANNARYDQLPYASRPFASTQPSRMAALATLFGLPFVPVAKARVLELGSSSGGNLIPLAARYPDARFTAVDLSAVQIAEGRARAEGLGLSNIRFEAADLLDFTVEAGSFDYIICHGVYSWVPEPVQKAILRLCKHALSEEGLALISYNVLPGWRFPQIMRDAFLSILPQQDDPRLQAEQAKMLAEFIGTNGLGADSYKAASTHWADRVKRSSDDYVAHEFLEPFNNPCTFNDFMASAAAEGLCFLSEAEFFTMIIDRYPADIAARIKQWTGNRMLPNEQMLDVLTGRTFRHTILTKAARDPLIQRNVTADRFSNLHMIASEKTTIEKSEDGPRLTNPAGWIRINDDLTMRMAERLVSRFPASSGVDDLAGSPDPERRKAALAFMHRTAFYGIASPQTEPVACRAMPSRKPRANALSIGDSMLGAAATANPRHESFELDDLSRFILPLLDGSRDKASLARAVEAAVLEGRLTLPATGIAPQVPGPPGKRIAAQISALLDRLGRTALLEADRE